MTIEAIIFYLVLLDSIIANAIAWFCPDFGKKNKAYKRFYKHVPITKAWTAIYLILVLWIGWSLSRLSII